jgi:hypothetical protein
LNADNLYNNHHYFFIVVHSKTRVTLTDLFLQSEESDDEVEGTSHLYVQIALDMIYWHGPVIPQRSQKRRRVANSDEEDGDTQGTQGTQKKQNITQQVRPVSTNRLW